MRRTVIAATLALLVVTLAGCASLQGAHERKTRAYPWGDSLLACEVQMRQEAHRADQIGAAAVTVLMFPIVVGAHGRLSSLTLCMGDAGWTPRHPDTQGVLQGEGMDWRPMTPAELGEWPTRKVAIQAYEQARADSIRKP